MAQHLTISGGTAAIEIELNDTPTARLLVERLPFDARAQLWGDEIYFASPVEADNQPGDAAEVQVGDVAYWPPGKAICLFFGPTPASRGDQPAAASPVTVVGRVVDGLDDCRRVSSGELLAVQPTSS